ncbi:hypothetical protein Bhyg_13281 [Pseudolycoriella hygida]|uniref:Uncharacterized protein n=1 Tax=Pseudolycoriella hygida TaxID=35572 RepID=A0A9Q0MN69_9DIPT|nr:hypothetical protein Bhyg_13281 [Pseudolycoriella hygida]
MKMISKNKKRKILIPKNAKLRKCSVQLGQIDKLLSNLKRSHGKLRLGAPPPPGTKLIRVKSDLFRKVVAPPVTSERVSKRTPKPNRRYMNDDTVSSTTWHEREISSGQPSEEEIENERPKSPQTEPTRKNRNRVVAPKTVATATNKESDKLALTKRKISYDEKPSPKQHKKNYSSDDDYVVSDSDAESLTCAQKNVPNATKSASKQASTKQVNSRSRPLIKLPPTTKQKFSPARSPPKTSSKVPPLVTTQIPSNKSAKSKESSTDAKPNLTVDLEDFEQMPTFTIVNINDIINQKEEVVVIEKSPSKPGKKVKTIPTKKAEPREPEDLIAELMQEDDDYDPKQNDSSTAIKTPASRRKTPHKVLSDQVSQPTATKETKPIVTKTTEKTTAVPTKPYRNIIGGKNNGKLKLVSPEKHEKQPPRILNSQLCTKVSTELPSVVAKISSPTKTVNNNNKTVLNRSKENIKQQVKPAPVTNVTTISGGRKVRKITCFETWFVIKLPHIEPTVPQSILDMELLKLGNEIKEISLPSSDWNYKITLSRITKPNPNGLIYCGEVQDANIKEEEKHFYQPTTIMFRRECKNNALRMQFDRAVIMKNRNFFINVDGKNVKLIGAPQFVQNFEDIETLLQIVENLSLTDPLVEQTTYVI